MTTFGLSSYLRLISLPARPQRTVLKARLSPREKAYDYHRSLRDVIGRLIVGEPLGDIQALIQKIKNPAERLSAITGMANFLAWRERNASTVTQSDPLICESPNGIFKVRFMSNFTLEISGARVAVHVWNTQTPELDLRMMYGALSVFPQSSLRAPLDLAVLSLRNSRLYRLSDVEDHRMVGIATMTSVERMFVDIRTELRTPSQVPNQRPTSPPPV